MAVTNQQQTLTVMFQAEESRWLLIANAIIEVSGNDCPDEVREQWESEIGEPMPEGESVMGSRTGAIPFDTLEELTGWLSANLTKMWSWLVGLDSEMPADLPLPNN